MEHTNAKQTLLHGQDTDQRLQERHRPDHLLAITLYAHKLYQNATERTKTRLTDGQDTDTTYKKRY